MAQEVNLTAALRSNLVQLQKTEVLLARTQERLATGKKVNTALDNPANFFAAKGHTDRAERFDSRKDGISEAIQTIKSADEGIVSIDTLIESARGLLTQMRNSTGSTTDLSALITQYQTVLTQIGNTVTDSSYKGVNFLNGGSTSVALNETGSSSLTITGFSADFSSLGITNVTTTTQVDTQAEIDTAEGTLNSAKTTLTTRSAALASNLSILTARDDFLTSKINTLKEGAGKLTDADTNEEGANLLALQTRQQLGITSLSLASQAAQSVLSLF